MTLEGTYHWIVILESKMKKGRPVATRYFGVFQDGTLKTRGLAHRRRDTPIYAREVQEEMLAILARARSVKEFRSYSAIWNPERWSAKWPCSTTRHARPLRPRSKPAC